MNKKIAIIAVASSLAVSLSAFASTGPAYSQSGYNGDWTQGWYVGAGVAGDSQSVMDLKSRSDVFGNQAANSDIKQNHAGIGFDVYVGRQVSDWFGAELGFTWLNDSKFKVTNSSSGEHVQTIRVEDQWNVHLVGVGKLPLGDYFNAFAKLGGAYFESDQRYKDISSGVKTTETTHTFGITYGVGIELVYEQFGLRTEYNVIQPAENVRDDFYVADVISANVFYKFM